MSTLLGPNSPEQQNVQSRLVYASIFQFADSDNDGLLSMAELEQFRAMRCVSRDFGMVHHCDLLPED